MPWQQRVGEIVAELRRHPGLPGLVMAVQRAGGPVKVAAFGADADDRALALDSLLPVASLTKLATALTVLRCVDEGALTLDAPLADVLPDAQAAQAAQTAHPGVTLRTLLSHTAGLPGDVTRNVPAYAPGLTWARMAPALLAEPLARQPGTRVYYSNAGIGLASLAVERVRGQTIQAAMQELVLQPLGIEGYLGAEPPRTPARVTGVLGDHVGTPLEPYNTPWYRTLGFPWGGLITTAAGALALVRAFAPTEASVLSPALRAEAVRDQTHGLPGGLTPSIKWEHCAWGLGPELHDDKTPHFAPASASARTFGHVGQSGAYAAWDPAAGVGWALLGTLTMETWWRRMAAIGEAVIHDVHGFRG